MKTIVGITALAVLFVASGPARAAAQEQGTAPERHRTGHDQRMATYLALSQEQQATWKSLQEQHKAEMEPLREEGRTLHEQLRAAMNAPNPDPAAVGAATLAMKEHRDKVEAARKTFEAQLKTTLTEEQKTKFDALKAAHRSGRRGWKE
jgi:Spy/CpxP family protein refolding chaperone